MAKKEKEEVKKQTPEETPQEPVEETPKEKTPEEPKQKDANPWEEKYNSEHEARLRLAAEYDNFRKRSQKERQDIYTASRADVIKELLPILDNFDRAVVNSEANFEDYKKGIDLIFSQFKQLLEKNGVESYGEEGDTFDPNIHNAVMSVEDESLGENVIAQVFTKGYKLGDRIIREAVVKVANS